MLPLLALFLASFGIGINEYAPIGLLPDIALDMHVSLAKAGLVVSCYALAVTLGSPLLAIFTTRLSRHKAMQILILIFIVGNGLTALAPNFNLLLLARILTALCHGAFFGIGAVIAASVVPAKQKAQAIAFMIAGLTVANIIGVPLDTAIGQYFGWRAAFILVTIIGMLAAWALYLWIPRNLLSENPNVSAELKAFCRPQVLFTMLISILSSASLFSVLTYIVPLLENVTHVLPSTITWYLMLLGLGMTVGNYLGGKLADWKLMPSLIGMYILISLILILFSFTINNAIAAGITIFIWGILSFATIAPLQLKSVQESFGAPNLASTFNQAAFHLGNSTGALLSSLVVSHNDANTQLMWLGAVIAVFALIVTLFTFYKSQPTAQLVLL